MNYLIIINKQSFFTNWYEYNNNYINGMIVVNLIKNKISFDGLLWQDINDDNL